MINKVAGNLIIFQSGVGISRGTATACPTRFAYGIVRLDILLAVIIIAVMVFCNSNLILPNCIFIHCVMNAHARETAQPVKSIAPTLDSVADAFDELLAQIVTEDGLVKYSLLTAPQSENPQDNNSTPNLHAALKSIVQAYALMPVPSLQDNKREAEDTTSSNQDNQSESKQTIHNQRLAYLINAYNANVLMLVVEENLPLKVLDVDGFFDKKLIKVGRQDMTLNDLENKYIRVAGDPRIHAALNCAAISCPPISAKAYRTQTLDKQLNESCTLWVNDEKRNKVEKQTLKVSSIFTWFEKDFNVKPYNNTIGFLRHFAQPESKIGKLLEGVHKQNQTPELEYLEYDWSLNIYKNPGN